MSALSLSSAFEYCATAPRTAWRGVWIVDPFLTDALETMRQRETITVLTDATWMFPTARDATR
jgi:hypothetical protein